MYKPKFLITSSILNNIAEITEIKTIVERSKVLPLNEAQLKRQAIIRMVHTSTSIEGNRLAEFQVDKVLSGMAVSADQKSIQEVKNLQLAIKQMNKMIEDHEPLTMESILKLHKTLMIDLLPDEKKGAFRKGPIYLVDDYGDGREYLWYEGPPFSKVPYLINELLLWLKEAEKINLHPVLIAGIFHVQFLTIHPFADGNGRITRLITAYILSKYEYDFRNILVLEDYYNRDRTAYYNALNSVQGKHYHEGEDLTPWLEYFTIGFVVEAKKVAEKIQLIGFDQTKTAGEQIFLDPDEIKIMDFLSTVGKITSDDVMDVIKVAKRTSQLKLKKLVDKGLIKSEGKGPSTFYTLI